DIAGQHLPVVPVFGEWSFVGDKEVYEGVVRLAKDGQRLRNMIMSFNADIVARSPRKKPIFWAEQIAGYEHMYNSEDEYPYYLMNRTDESSGDLPAQPIGYIDNPEVPQANAYMLEAATAAVKEVASLGVGTEAAGSQVAFDTINQLNARSDMETYVFLDNLSTAMRRDGEIYASMVNDIYDVPRQVMMTMPDGSEKDVEVLNQVVDYQTGQVVTLNDVRGRYETYTDTGPSFQSMKSQNRAEILDLMGKVQPGTPEYQMLLLQYFTLLDGKGVEMMREYANKQLVMMGLKKPETPEEEQMVAEAQQQPKEPSPEDKLAQGALLTGQADLQKAMNDEQRIQVDAMKAQADIQLSNAKIAEILASVDLDKQKEVREMLKVLGQFQQQQGDNARADVELLLKGANQTHSRRMDATKLMQQSNNPSGRAAEIPQ
ncbi:portal protein, partial [Yersinia pseudotuberculosis]